MRESAALSLVYVCCLMAGSQTPSTGWKTIKDAKGLCQITVPEDWAPLGEGKGAAMFQDPTIGLAVVTSQPGQEFKPLSAALIKLFGLRKEKVFENTATRIFYQDRTSRNPEDTSAFDAAVPAKNGTCSSRVVFLPSIPEDLAKKIALSVSPAGPK